MRIGVVADTHDRLAEEVLAGLAGVDELWHLGDVVTPFILDRFHVLSVPIRVVRGNCDTESAWPLVLDLNRCGIRFRLQHIPPHALPENTDVCLHGHTHVPRDEKIGGIRFLNPGTVGKPNKGVPSGYAILTLQPGAELLWEQRKLKKP